MFGGGIFFQFFQDRVAVQFWQDYIQQHQIGPGGFGQLQSLLSVTGRDHLKIFFRQKFSQRLPERCFILDD
jgi:hypothetical protein